MNSEPRCQEREIESNEASQAKIDSILSKSNHGIKWDQIYRTLFPAEAVPSPCE